MCMYERERETGRQRERWRESRAEKGGGGEVMWGRRRKKRRGGGDYLRLRTYRIDHN